MASRGKGGFRIEVSSELANWEQAFDTAGDPGPAAEQVWQVATDVLFDATQQVVHVVTGHLKASGSSKVKVEGNLVVGEIEYAAEYALDEIQRGGDHDFMQRGLEQVHGVFESAVLDAVAAELAGKGIG